MSRLETYLGDGLYVSHDGFHYILRTERNGVNHWVALEDFVLDAFLVFVQDVEGVKFTVQKVREEK